MAIKIDIDAEDLAAAEAGWELGGISSHRGLPEGSVNTLYVLETGAGRCVLRLSEGRTQEELAFETSLLSHLEAARFPSLRVIPRRDGAAFAPMKGAWACVFRWVAGTHSAPDLLSREAFLDLGRVLARLHTLTEPLPGGPEGRYEPPQVRRWVEALSIDPRIEEDEELRASLPELLREAAALEALPSAPEGIIHSDLFPDNIKWIGDRVSALLDFEMASRGPFVLDLATCLLAFGWSADGFVPGRLLAIVEGYESQRPLGREEKALIYPWARFAALRFTVTRIRDFHLSELDEGRLVKKDWRRFRDRLRRLVALGPEGFAALIQG